MSQITKLSIEDQFHFKFLIESVLTEMEEGSLTAESFENILKKQGQDLVFFTFMLYSSTRFTEFAKNVLKKIES